MNVYINTCICIYNSSLWSLMNILSCYLLYSIQYYILRQYKLEFTEINNLNRFMYNVYVQSSSHFIVIESIVNVKWLNEFSKIHL